MNFGLIITLTIHIVVLKFTFRFDFSINSSDVFVSCDFSDQSLGTKLINNRHGAFHICDEPEIKHVNFYFEKNRKRPSEHFYLLFGKRMLPDVIYLFSNDSLLSSVLPEPAAPL